MIGLFRRIFGGPSISKTEVQDSSCSNNKNTRQTPVNLQDNTGKKPFAEKSPEIFRKTLFSLEVLIVQLNNLLLYKYDSNQAGLSRNSFENHPQTIFTLDAAKELSAQLFKAGVKDEKYLSCLKRISDNTYAVVYSSKKTTGIPKVLSRLNELRDDLANQYAKSKASSSSETTATEPGRSEENEKAIIVYLSRSEAMCRCTKPGQITSDQHLINFDYTEDAITEINSFLCSEKSNSTAGAIVATTRNIEKIKDNMSKIRTNQRSAREKEQQRLLERAKRRNDSHNNSIHSRAIDDYRAMIEQGKMEKEIRHRTESALKHQVAAQYFAEGKTEEGVVTMLLGAKSGNVYAALNKKK